MYLSRIKLDLTRQTTRRALASPQVMHAIVEGCFDEPVKHRKLWRIDNLKGNTYVMVLSVTEPDFTDLANQLCSMGEKADMKDCTKLLSQVQVGQKFHFRLCGNPTYKAKVAGEKNGKLYAHVTESQQCEWLKKKAELCGFKLDSVAVSSSTLNKFHRGTATAKVEVNSVCFEGVLEVTATESFISALTTGIGRAKAYGCGLMTVIPLV